MTTLRLKPRRGGFNRPFGCGWFVREFLGGHSVYGSPIIDPAVGASSLDIFHSYKDALHRAHAVAKAIETETRMARRRGRPVDPDSIGRLYDLHLARVRNDDGGCSYRSFKAYFANLARLGWVEPPDRVESSTSQEENSSRPALQLYRLTRAGVAASDSAWADPRFALYHYR